MRERETSPGNATGNGSPPGATGGRVDPLAVTPDALAADEEEQTIADEADRPGLIGRVADRSRGGLARLRGKGSRDRSEAAAVPLARPEDEAPAAPAAPDSADEGWVLHDGSDSAGYDGWLYHYADGVIVDADGTVHEYAVPVAGPEPEPEAVAEPEPEPEPEPEAVAELESEPEPEPEAVAEPEPETQHEDEVDEDADIPGFVEYSPSNARRYVFGAVFVASAVASVLAIFVAVQDRSSNNLLVAIALVAVAAASWWALLGWSPTVISIRDGILEVAKGPGGDRFDLRDPATEVDLGEKPGSPTWRARFQEPEGSKVAIRRGQVKPRQFARIVEHHRSRLRDPEPADDESQGRT